MTNQVTGQDCRRQKLHWTEKEPNSLLAIFYRGYHFRSDKTQGANNPYCDPAEEPNFGVAEFDRTPSCEGVLANPITLNPNNMG